MFIIFVFDIFLNKKFYTRDKKFLQYWKKKIYFTDSSGIFIHTIYVLSLETLWHTPYRERQISEHLQPRLISLKYNASNKLV